MCFPFGVKRLWNISGSAKVSESETLLFGEHFLGPVAQPQAPKIADKRSASVSVIAIKNTPRYRAINLEVIISGAVMFGFFRKRIKSADDIDKLLTAEGPVKAGEILRSEAEKGNLTCQIFLSEMLLGTMDKETNPAILRDLTKRFVKYAEMAALQGDAGTQYNLGKHLLTVVSEDIQAGNGKLSENGRDLLRDSKKYLSMAANQNLSEAMESLSNLQDLFNWAESQEYV